MLSSGYTQLEPCFRTSLLILTFMEERELRGDCFCALTRGMGCCRVRKRVMGDLWLRQRLKNLAGKLSLFLC